MTVKDLQTTSPDSKGLGLMVVAKKLTFPVVNIQYGDSGTCKLCVHNLDNNFLETKKHVFLPPLTHKISYLLYKYFNILMPLYYLNIYSSILRTHITYLVLIFNVKHTRNLRLLWFSNEFNCPSPVLFVK